MNHLATKLLETNPIDNLFESSLSRILKHWESTPFILMSSWRPERSDRENIGAFSDLCRKIKGMGYGFVKVEGYGQNDAEKVTTSEEPSLLVINHRKDEHFLSQLTNLAVEFSQWGLVYSDGTGKGYLYNSAGKIEEEYSNLRTMAARYMTSLVRRSAAAYTHDKETRKPINNPREFHFEGIRRAPYSGIVSMRIRSLLGEE